MCVNLEVLRKLCEKSRCFPGKFTQLAQILHDRRSWRSRQISTLIIRAPEIRLWWSRLHFSQLTEHVKAAGFNWSLSDSIKKSVIPDYCPQPPASLKGIDEYLIERLVLNQIQECKMDSSTPSTVATKMKCHKWQSSLNIKYFWVLQRMFWKY